MYITEVHRNITDGFEMIFVCRHKGTLISAARLVLTVQLDS